MLTATVEWTLDCKIQGDDEHALPAHVTWELRSNDITEPLRELQLAATKQFSQLRAKGKQVEDCDGVPLESVTCGEG